MTRAQLVSAATGAALKAHRDYNIDRRNRVDVFAVLRQAATEVFFRPLKQICGAYLPGNTAAPGVLINSNLPLSRQRYTAAHEFGHLFLGHDVISVDKDVGITVEERRSLVAEEYVAETFAAFFLMPPALIESSLRDLNSSKLTPEVVYLLSLKMGTSYLATVNHLQALRKLSGSQAARFRSIQPKVIKAGLSPEVASRHDAWVLDEHWNQQAIFPAVQDTVVFRLTETPTSGYTWVWNTDPVNLRILRDGYTGDGDKDIGGTGVRELVMEVMPDAQEEHVGLQRRRPWDGEGSASASFSVDLVPQHLKKTGPLTPPTLRIH